MIMDEAKNYPPYLDYPKPYKAKTNADSIRTMSDEELANFLTDFSNNGGWTTEIGRKSCYKTIADYLQQPAEAKHGCDFAKKMGFSSCDKCPIDCDIRQMPENKEYIERKALLDRYDAEHVGPPGRARELIATAPVADVVEVRHGRWIRPHWKNSNYCCDCSECGGEAMHRDYQWDKNGIYPICPNCGAYMTGENNE
jgi:hypothetical protein